MNWEQCDSVLEVAATLADVSSEVDDALVIIQGKNGLRVLHNGKIEIRTAIYMMETVKFQMVSATVARGNDAANASQSGA